MTVNANEVSLEETLKKLFGDKIHPIQGGFKVNIKNLINSGMKALLEFDDTHDIQVNRSGPGIVIRVTDKSK